MSHLRFSRREFLAASAALSAMALPAVAIRQGQCAGGQPLMVSDDVIQFALIAETHAVETDLTEDEFVCGRNDGFLMTNEALEVCVTQLQNLGPHLEFVIHAGNLLHGWRPLSSVEYFTRETALDTVRYELKRVLRPFYFALGPRDYGAFSANRALAHEILRAKLDIEPFSAFEHKGWTFVMLNSNFSKAGGLGKEQLQWFESIVQRSLKLIVTMHAHPLALERDEKDIFSAIVASNSSKIQQIFCGTWGENPEYNFCGVPVQAVSEQRHDADSLLIVRLDRKSGSLRFLNEWALA